MLAATLDVQNAVLEPDPARCKDSSRIGMSEDAHDGC
jgi:hypothetical protein